MTRIGIIGLGFMGRVHYDTYSKVSGAKWSRSATPTRSARPATCRTRGATWTRAATRQLPMDRIKGTCDMARAVHDAADVDVIDICLPTPAHVDVVTAALATGKHVLCEKPLARTCADAG